VKERVYKMDGLYREGIVDGWMDGEGESI